LKFRNFFGFFSKDPALNAQTNPDIEKRQLPCNGIKNLLDSVEVLIFIYPKRKVCLRALGVSFAESWVSRTGIQFKRLNLGRVKQEEKQAKLSY